MPLGTMNVWPLVAINPTIKIRLRQTTSGELWNRGHPVFHSFFSAPVQSLLLCSQVTWLRSKRPISKLSGDTNSEQNFCMTLSVQVQCDLAFRARARKTLFQDMQCFAYSLCVVCCAVSPSCQKSPQMEWQPVRLYIRTKIMLLNAVI